ncbi:MULTISPECIES: hypothetical protein [unclassified Paraburkholderia]|uniref:hypothetical protein n=1 Tax=unclassified Paraburkholderia TaxID=2615204 RepID=UPI002AAFE8F0|nr:MULTISPECIES: hypothetical protein [unclassified Paraburkholderia]
MGFGQFLSGPNFIIAVSLLNLGDHEPGLRQKVRAMSRNHRLPVEKVMIAGVAALWPSRRTGEDGAQHYPGVYRGMVMRKFLRNDPEYTRFTTEHWSKIARA